MNKTQSLLIKKFRDSVINEFLNEMHCQLAQYESEYHYGAKITCDIDDVYTWLEKAKKNLK